MKSEQAKPSHGSSRFCGNRARVRPAWERRAGSIDSPGYREVLDQVLPGAFDQHVADADTFFGVEIPAMRQWSFTQDDAHRIRQPVLAVIGAKSRELGPVWNERQELLLAWLPNAEPFVLPEANHLLQVQNPRGMAAGLAAFFARHPFVV